MSPDDARHGSTRGFHAGCREPCCRLAYARYEKRGKVRRSRGETWAIPSLGAQRRIQALMRLGWTSADIAAAAGWNHRNRVSQVLNGQAGKPCRWVERKTHLAISEAYERLSMRLPTPAPHRARTATIAARKGWPPPLGWDDIDTDLAPTSAPAAGPWEEHYDEAMVLRVINRGTRPRKLTTTEAAEVVRRLIARGLSTREIADLYGLKVERYYRVGDAA